MNTKTPPEIDDYHALSTIGNALERGGPKAWDWSRNRGHYFTHQDFFSIHWEIHLPKFPDAIRLHVEAPRFEKDKDLNTLKREVVEAILASDIEKIAAQEGLDFRRGRKITLESMKANKCTEPFRVVLTEAQRGSTHRADIEMIHKALGHSIAEVLEDFTPQLNKLFNRE